MKARPEFLNLAIKAGAQLTGKPDGTEPVTVVFTPEAWQSFDALTLSERANSKLSEDAKVWCVYIAGLVATCLGLEETKIKTVAGIIERRLWRLGATLPVVEPLAWEADYEACKCPDNPSRCFSDRVFRMMHKYAHAVPAIAQGEPVATDWERIARVQDAKLRAMCGEPGGFEKLCEVLDRYEKAQSTQPVEPVAFVDEDGVINVSHYTYKPGDKLYTAPPAGAEPRTHVDDAAQKLDKLLDQVINRRVMVEQKLFDMAAGKLPMPDEEGLRKLAMELGDPAHNPQPVQPVEPVATVGDLRREKYNELVHNNDYTSLNSGKCKPTDPLYTKAPAVAINEQLLEVLRLIRGKHGCGALTLPEADLERVDAAIAAAKAEKTKGGA